MTTERRPRKHRHPTVALLFALIFLSIPLAQVTGAAPLDPDDVRIYMPKGTWVSHSWILTDLDAPERHECYIHKTDESMPVDEDVLGYCGKWYYNKWLKTPPCQEENPDLPVCTGLTLYDLGMVDDQLTVDITLPVAQASIELGNCPVWGLCDSPPVLVFLGKDPLRNHHIVNMRIKTPSKNITCQDVELCIVEMPETGAEGTDVIIELTSTYGDTRDSYTFRMRNLRLDDGRYQFELIGTPWDNEIPAGAAFWGIFPDLAGLPDWLMPVSTPDDLYTSHDYALLAGNLILRGEVDISGCPDGALLENNAANTCGLEVAEDAINYYQNRYDPILLAAAEANHIPPVLLKGVVGQESQFWPYWVIENEYGMGMLTDEGIDLMLTWNTAAYLDLCLSEYEKRDCAWGYTKLDQYPKDVLRGKALSVVGTDAEFDLIAETLVAAAAQTGQVVRNATGKQPYEIMTYAEMWMLSLGLYNQGAGCIYEAVLDTVGLYEEISWGNITEHLAGDCQIGADYPYWVITYGLP